MAGEVAQGQAAVGGFGVHVALEPNDGHPTIHGAELGGDLQKFVGTLLMTMITQAGFSRNEIAEGQREFWRLTVDEFQKFIAMSGSAIGPDCCGGTTLAAATACSSASVFSLSPNGGRPSMAA